MRAGDVGAALSLVGAVGAGVVLSEGAEKLIADPAQRETVRTGAVLGGAVTGIGLFMHGLDGAFKARGLAVPLGASLATVGGIGLCAATAGFAAAWVGRGIAD